MDTAIAKAQEKIDFVSQNEEMLDAYYRREMAIMDYNSDMSSAREEGKEEGIAVGKEEGIAIGKKEGIAIGKKEGIAIGKEEGIAIGKEEGIAIGEQRGEQKVQIKNVLRLSQKGKSIEEIAEIFNLSIDETNDILKNAGL